MTAPTIYRNGTYKPLPFDEPIRFQSGVTGRVGYGPNDFVNCRATVKLSDGRRVTVRAYYRPVSKVDTVCLEEIEDALGEKITLKLQLS